MRNPFLCICLVFGILLLPLAQAAMLHGFVYDLDFEPLSKVVVEINTTPQQTYVAIDGAYEFNVPPGVYVLTVSLPQGQTLVPYAQENVTVLQEGEYVVDLFTFPELEGEELDVDVEAGAQAIADTPSQPPSQLPYVFAAIAVLGLVGILYFLLRRHTIKPSVSTKKSVSAPAVPQGAPLQEDPAESAEGGLPSPSVPSAGSAKESPAMQDTDLVELIDIIRKEGGRMNQKDLRKSMPLSEAKISLMVAELEHKGVLQKIKKGRGNILILKQ